MDSKIVTGGKMEKAVFLEIENEELQFMGFIKANVSMNEETRKIANTILSKLYETWTGKYHKLSWIQYKTEFRYESLKDIQPFLNNAREEGILDSEKIYMSLIAVCNFPKKRKLFWISTGNDMVYISKSGKILNKLCHKMDKSTLKELNLITMSRDFFFKTNGEVTGKHNHVFIVSYDAIEHFEKCIEDGVEVWQERIESLSYNKAKPIIIGEISSV